MASASDAVEDSLVKAQRALAVVYEDAYPCSNRVRQGLEGILNQRYGGSQHKFTNEFITPTILFLKRLKAKGFPLVKEGKVIVHLLAPSNHLESGEMFFQIGHGTPGTLSLKFTKYHKNLVVFQPATIQENELHLAFTQQFIEKMRKKAPKLGDQLMRVLLTSTENGQRVYAIDKIEVKKIMPDLSGDCIGSACHLPVMETAMPKCFEASDSQHFPATGNWSDQAVGSQTGPEPGRQPQEHSSRTSANDPPLLVQAVGDDSHKPASHHQTNHHVENDPSPATGHHSPNQNPVYPPLVQAAQDDPTTTATGDQSQERPSTGHTSNEAYPPLVQAAQDDPTTSATSDQSQEHSSTDHRNNEPYPPLVQTAQDDPTTLATGDQLQEHSSTGHTSNRAYPPLLQAIQNDPQDHSSTGHTSNRAYPPLLQAIQNDPQDHSSTDHTSNRAYPPLVQAVQDDPTPTATGGQSQEHSSTGHTSNRAYPPPVKAVKDDPTTSATSDQSREHSSTDHRSNEPYPPLMQAVRDNPLVTPATDHQPINNPAHSPCTQTTGDDPSATVCMPVDDLDLF